VESPFDQEIRFALVMYGGASLAIYMNGVTQEFLHLVQATSVDSSKGTAAVYRELAEIVRARFVVDIASGTSAGGINAIFLGKALANGQSLDHLSRLWLDEADLSGLWNNSHAPKSLLSGPDMYGKLARALQGMDDCGGMGALQSEMDVFITSTDIQGLELPIQLSDMTIAEKRHKNVFHLRFAAGRDNDFEREMNPFLAFAARATSAFPFAFEPMRLADVGEGGADPLVRSRPPGRLLRDEGVPRGPGGPPHLGRFFPDYLNAGDADYAFRAFGDGGYLNNKPFSYVIDELPRRITELPVQRKLAYIEPSPEQAAGNATQARPGVLRNSLDAGITLRSYETIREDLQRILDRNRLIERVREVVDGVEEDVKKWQACGMPRAERREGQEYARRTIADEIHERGPGYAGYHRLKIRAVTDELAAIAGCDVKIIEEWRARTQSSESLFLLHFDLGYRQRRVRFLLSKLSGPSQLRREINRVASDLEDLRRRSRERTFVEQAFSPALFAETVRKEFQKVTQRTAEDLERCLCGHPLKRYFDDYEYYDQVTFPIFYETDVGEPEPVDVFRISPWDARTVIDERSDAKHRKKLAGTALFHFGAFLKRDWRSNDILWGRLDGAERIITAILPPGTRGSEHAARLIREAHLAIVRETFAGDEAMYKHLQTNYQVNRKLGWADALKLVCRAGFIAGKMWRAF
jgi:patatin-related protein